uniref:Uncharacterized protein n=1 Tax=Panagrolaimus sp. JU765 TaxID=591449 RepID=A0AC34R7B5_9BILA
MDSEMTLLTPQPFDESEIEAAKKLRIKLAEILPPEFDSDFFLARWLRAYKDDEKGLELKLTELIEHRRAIGYDSGDIVDKSRQLEFAKKTFERFFISQLKMDVYSDNVAVFVQKMEGCDLKEITKVIPLSYVLHSYFILHEAFQRAMARKEAETGKPAAVAVVLDLKDDHAVLDASARSFVADVAAGQAHCRRQNTVQNCFHHKNRRHSQVFEARIDSS